MLLARGGVQPFHQIHACPWVGDFKRFFGLHDGDYGDRRLRPLVGDMTGSLS